MGVPERGAARPKSGISRGARGSATPDDASSFGDARSDTSVEMSRRALNFPGEIPTTPTTSVTSTTFMTADQLSEWSHSWSMLSPQEYFHQQQLERDEQGCPSGVHNNNNEEAEVHIKSITKTKLPYGNSLLVDLGSKVNVVGQNTQKELTSKSDAHDLETEYLQRDQRLNLNGVGTDSAPCDYEAIIPIAVKFEEQAATLESYRANIATGCGANLPAILGALSMQEKDSVLILRPGKELIAFPGPGGYKIEWSPGTKLLPMVPSPSGHLVIPCDRFKELPKGKKDVEQIAFWTDHSKPE